MVEVLRVPVEDDHLSIHGVAIMTERVDVREEPIVE